MRRVLRRVRPDRPSIPDGDTMSDKMWNLTTSCWLHIASDRPQTAEVATQLGNIISPYASVPIPDAQIDLLPQLHQAPLARVTSPPPPDSFIKLMNETPETPAEKEAFVQKAIEEGEKLQGLGTHRHSKGSVYEIDFLPCRT